MHHRLFAIGRDGPGKAGYRRAVPVHLMMQVTQEVKRVRMVGRFGQDSPIGRLGLVELSCAM